MLNLRRVSSSDAEFKKLTNELDEYLSTIYFNYYERFGSENILDENVLVVIGYMDDLLAGCGALRPIDDNSAVELKRMFVREEFRGKRISIAILKELESWAKELGHATIILETGTRQPEAISLYQTNGYVVTKPFGDYSEETESICMKKELLTS